MLEISSLVPLPFLNPAWTSGSSWFMYCWSLAWRILTLTLLAREITATVWQFEHSLSLPFRIGMKTDLYQSCGHCWVFQICWHIECSTLTALSFRILNSSAGLASSPLALFIVMLLRPTWPHTPGSRWVTTLSWLSWSLRPFFFFSSIYSCLLFFISFASVISFLSLSCIVSILAWNFPLISQFSSRDL